MAFPRFALFLLALATVVASSQLPHVAAAADRMEWSFTEFNDPDNKGRLTARLSYSVPETDNIQVSGVCDGTPSTGAKYSSVTFGADTGKLQEGSQVDLHFTGGGFDHVMKGAVYGTQAEVGVAGVHLDIEHNDPLWQALQEKDQLDYLVPGYRASTLDLTRGKEKIKSFIEACRAYAKAILGDDYDGASKQQAAGGNDSEKEAFESAKELGTVEAWDAFLANYPSGFHADLARAYIKKLGASSAASDTGVTGLNVTYVEYPAGAFIKNGPKTWVEQKKAGGDALRFDETFRSEQEVKLFDKRRKVHISLNIAGGSILYAPDGSALTKLYDIVSTRGSDAPPPAAPPPPANAQALGPVLSSISKAPDPKTLAEIPYPAQRSCSERANLRSERSDTPAKITFVHYSGPRRDVHWLDYSGQARNMITVKPGQQTTADTFLTHPWMITDASGNCIEIVLPRPVPSVVRFGTPSQPAKSSSSAKKCRRGFLRIEGKCIRKRDAASYCGPGYRLQGDKCVQGYQAPKPQAQRPSWQIEAIKKGCKPGLAWNPQEGCHEND
jgi:hypothetical protein